MTDRSSVSIKKYVIEEEQKLLKANKLANIMDILWSVILPWFSYTVVCDIFTMVSVNSLINSAISLFTYVFALLWMAVAVSKRKKRNEYFVLSQQEIALTVKIVLLMNILFFVILFFVGLTIGARDWDCVTAAIINLTLYVGFVVSLESLFGVGNICEVLKCFGAQLIKPIKQLFNEGIKVIVLVVAVALSAIIVGLSKCYGLELVIAMLIVIAILLILEKWRNNSKNIFVNELADIILEKKVLILQLGTDYIVGNAIREHFEKDVEIIPILEPEILKFDVIVVLNSLSKNEYIGKFGDLGAYLKPNGCVVDPFAIGKKHCYIMAWYGMPRRNPQCYTAEEYMKIVNAE